MHRQRRPRIAQICDSVMDVPRPATDRIRPRIQLGLGRLPTADPLDNLERPTLGVLDVHSRALLAARTRPGR